MRTPLPSLRRPSTVGAGTTGTPPSTPYLSEGKKTVTLEIMEQLHWQVPDYIALSVGDGCTIAGAWKGLKDLCAAGFIDRLPRLISVQAEGCCPLNRAIQTGEPWRPHGGEHPGRLHRRRRPRNADKALAAIRESWDWPSPSPTRRSWMPCACWAAPRGSLASPPVSPAPPA